MKITLEPTPVMMLGARAWEGKTEIGTAVVAFITRLGVSIDADPSEFAELVEVVPPVVAVCLGCDLRDGLVDEDGLCSTCGDSVILTDTAGADALRARA